MKKFKFILSISNPIIFQFDKDRYEISIKKFEEIPIFGNKFGFHSIEAIQIRKTDPEGLVTDSFIIRKFGKMNCSYYALDKINYIRIKDISRNQSQYEVTLNEKKPRDGVDYSIIVAQRKTSEGIYYAYGINTINDSKNSQQHFTKIIKFDGNNFYIDETATNFEKQYLEFVREIAHYRALTELKQPELESYDYEVWPFYIKGATIEAIKNQPYETMTFFHDCAVTTGVIIRAEIPEFLKDVCAAKDYHVITFERLWDDKAKSFECYIFAEGTEFEIRNFEHTNDQDILKATGYKYFISLSNEFDTGKATLTYGNSNQGILEKHKTSVTLKFMTGLKELSGKEKAEIVDFIKNS